MFLGKKNSGSEIRFYRKSDKTDFPPKSVFLDFRKNRIPDPDFFSLKTSPDQYGANKKRFSQIGPAVPELLRDTQTHTQTDKHTDKNPYYFVVLISPLSLKYNQSIV